jgi:hypothetical protein
LLNTTDCKAIEAHLLRDRDIRLRRQQVEDAVQLLAAIGRLPAEIDAAPVGLRVRDTGPLGELCCLGLRACPSAAMNPISASRTAFSIGLVVAPSNVIPLMTVRTMTPRRMSSRMVSTTSS